MAEKKTKTVNLYYVKLIKPETIQAIIDAPDGGFVPCQRSELDAIHSLTYYPEDMDRVYEERTGTKPAKAGKSGGRA